MQYGVVLFLVVTMLGAQQVERTQPEEDTYEKVFDVGEYGAPWMTGDTNNDGRIDYGLELDEYNEKKREVVDFNHDGMMDDFYFYVNGVLEREELDTNFDGRIDLWIFMHDGVRVAGYERDTDYDGSVDLVKEFGDS